MTGSTQSAYEFISSFMLAMFALMLLAGVCSVVRTERGRAAHRRRVHVDSAASFVSLIDSGQPFDWELDPEYAT